MNPLLYNSFVSSSPFRCHLNLPFMSKLWQARFFTTVNQLRDLPGTQVP